MRAVKAENFADVMSKYADTVREDYAKTVRAVTIAWFSGVIKRTPVDTGLMRGNWLTSAGSPNYSVVSRKDISGALTELKNNLDPFGITYLTNNLSYAEQREREGGSPVYEGKGVGGNFVEEEFLRVKQNMEAIIANA